MLSSCRSQDRAVPVRLVHGPRHDRRGVGPTRPPEARLARQGRRPGRQRRHAQYDRPVRSRGHAASSPRRRARRTACSAVGANAWASPVQPRRSSRWGQSVGTETKLSRCDQTTFSWSRSRRRVRARERPAPRRVAADRHERPPRAPRRRLDLRVLEAMEREARLEVGLRLVREDVRVRCPSGA